MATSSWSSKHITAEAEPSIPERVLSHIPTGRADPITNKALADAVDIEPRLVQSIIQDLRRSGTLVCSTSRHPAGYYFPANEVESEDGIATFRHRFLELKDTLQALEQKHARRYGPAQLTLDAGDAT